MKDALVTGARNPEDFIPGDAAAYRSPDHGEVYLIAMEFADRAGVESVGVWASNSLDPLAGLKLSVDGFANEFTDWPEAATTEAAINAASPGVAEAVACLPE